MISKVYSCVGVVVGASRGIGLAIARQITLQYAESVSEGGPLLIYITAKTHAGAGPALSTLIIDPELAKARSLHTHGGKVTITIETVDITDRSSIDRFALTIGERHGGQLDFLINNAAVVHKGYDHVSVARSIACNFEGTLAMCHALRPYMRPGTGHIINVSCASAHLRNFSPACAALFLNAPDQHSIRTILHSFELAALHGTVVSAGWMPDAHVMTKAAVVASTRALAAEDLMTALGRQSPVFYSSCAPSLLPGMRPTGTGGSLSFDDLAQTVVFLALNGSAGHTGGLWEYGQLVEW